MKIRTIAVNGVVAALYIAITALIQPIAFGAVQYRIPEMFNHLVVFNKKYFIGIIIGVFFSNLFFSPIALDVFFGVGHSIISLGLTLFVSKYVKNIWGRMAANTVIFTLTMCIIAFQIDLSEGFVEDFPFWEVWAFLSIGEFVVMAIGMPVMYVLNKRIKFNHVLEK